jgi:hypothetical protein
MERHRAGKQEISQKWLIYTSHSNVPLSFFVILYTVILFPFIHLDDSLLLCIYL